MHKQVHLHIEAVLQEMRTLFLDAASRLENVKLGEKITATKLTEDLAKERGQKTTALYPVLHLMLNDYPKMESKAGKFGGIYRVETWENEPDTEEGDIK